VIQTYSSPSFFVLLFALLEDVNSSYNVILYGQATF
jgi:hypothetical protein